MGGSDAIRVVSLESRQASAMVRLLERHGCEPISAPSMREIPLTDQEEAFAFGERLLASEVDLMVLLTGVGTRLLVEALSTRWPEAEVVAALGRTRLCCRGPKPVAALKALGLRPALVAPEPNTWQELLDVMSPELASAQGLRVWVQEYGRPTPQLTEALEARGATSEPCRSTRGRCHSILRPSRPGFARSRSATPMPCSSRAASRSIICCNSRPSLVAPMRSERRCTNTSCACRSARSRAKRCARTVCRSI
jgi:hypothetical protein